MADTSELRNGLIIRFKNEPFLVVEFQHVKPGKGGAFVRTTLKNMKTGKVLDNTFRSGESIDVVQIERRKYQYLYKEGEFFVLMDNETFDQINVPEEILGEGQVFLKEGDEIQIIYDDQEKIISSEIPMFVNLKVIETEPGYKGDTATNVLKPAKLETGAQISVPLFVNEGDLLKVDTRTGVYVERVKN
ncbi:MAG: elongation factor P [Ignavibacteria bacterium]|nr:elongation factor P [Ignavibacteria bacterium]